MVSCFLTFIRFPIVEQRWSVKQSSDIVVCRSYTQWNRLNGIRWPILDNTWTIIYHRWPVIIFILAQQQTLTIITLNIMPQIYIHWIYRWRVHRIVQSNIHITQLVPLQRLHYLRCLIHHHHRLTHLITKVIRLTIINGIKSSFKNELVLIIIWG